MKEKRRMTAADFEAVRPLLRISDDRAEAARLALVDGKTYDDIAGRYGWDTRQAVGNSVTAVWKVYERYQASQRAVSSADTLLPPGWEKVTLIAPAVLIEKFRREIAETVPVAAPGRGVKAGTKNSRAKEKARGG